MDEEFSVAGFKFGLDPILNLVPIAGDLGGYIISIALIFTMMKHGASGKLLVKMLGNASLDALLGAIPVLGWIFDFVFKANTYNVKLLSEFYAEGKHKGSGLDTVLIMLFLFLIVLIAVGWLSFWFLKTVTGYIDHNWLG
ncbi:MAG: DUF4112 domain-containing protein [Niastella sp.]|nr:DUF4112 domain-containing protein [Niastella sp.]